MEKWENPNQTFCLSSRQTDNVYLVDIKDQQASIHQATLNTLYILFGAITVLSVGFLALPQSKPDI